MLLMILVIPSGCFPSGGVWRCYVWVSADSVNVAAVRSVTRVLDAWGKRIFNEIKTLLHSEPNALLPDYSR